MDVSDDMIQTRENPPHKAGESLKPTVLEQKSKEVKEKFYQDKPVDVSASGEHISFNLSHIKQGLPQLQDEPKNSIGNSPEKLVPDEEKKADTAFHSNSK